MAKKKKTSKPKRKERKAKEISFDRLYEECYLGKISTKQTSVSARDFLLRAYLMHLNELANYVTNPNHGKHGNSRKEFAEHADKTLLVTGTIQALREFPNGWKLLIRSPMIAGYFKSGYHGDRNDVTFIESIYVDNHIWVDLGELYINEAEYISLGTELTFPLLAGMDVALVGEVSRYTGNVGGVEGYKFGFKGAVNLVGMFCSFTDYQQDAKKYYSEVLNHTFVRAKNKTKLAFLEPNVVFPRDFCIGSLTFRKIESDLGLYLGYPKVSFYSLSHANEMVNGAYKQLSEKDTSINYFGMPIGDVLIGFSTQFERTYHIYRARYKSQNPQVEQSYKKWSTERKLLNFDMPLVYWTGKEEEDVLQ